MNMTQNSIDFSYMGVISIATSWAERPLWIAKSATTKFNSSKRRTFMLGSL